MLVCRCSRYSEKTRKTYRLAKRFEKERTLTHAERVFLNSGAILMVTKQALSRDPQPAQIAPTGDGYMPLYCAAQWIATAGHAVPWDVAADALWGQAYRSLCDAIASEEVKIIGERNGEKGLVPSYLFANCEISHHANLSLPDEGQFYLSSCPISMRAAGWTASVIRWWVGTASPIGSAFVFKRRMYGGSGLLETLKLP